MPRQTVAQREAAAREVAREAKRSEVRHETSTVIVFQLADENPDNHGVVWEDAEIVARSDRDYALIKLPCGEERAIKVAALVALAQALSQ